MIINRVWAMPNKNTFTIIPIKNLLNKYVSKDKLWIDGFANESKIATITNDLNPDYNTDYNLDALDFFKTFKDDSVNGVLYDPPYSITQASQCYKDYGKEKLEINVSNMGYWGEIKNQISRILKSNGIVICFGWSSNGLGKNRGFEFLELLLVPHGGSKNDTIVTVEKKVYTQQNLFFD
jgi:hypothetical protein